MEREDHVANDGGPARHGRGVSADLLVLLLVDGRKAWRALESTERDINCGERASDGVCCVFGLLRCGVDCCVVAGGRPPIGRVVSGVESLTIARLRGRLGLTCELAGESGDSMTIGPLGWR